MRGSLAVTPTLISTLWPTREGSNILRFVLLAVVGSVLLTISAKVQVPFWPVPMTMQTMVVLIIGLTFGPGLGAATVALYVMEGALGLPVFAGTPEKGLGLAYMAGPTGGFLAGMFLSALALGKLAQLGWGRSVASAIGALMIGEVIIFGLGLTWLSYLIGFEKAVQFGFMPFALSEVLKIGLAAAMLPACWKLVQGRQK